MGERLGPQVTHASFNELSHIETEPGYFRVGAAISLAPGWPVAFAELRRWGGCADSGLLYATPKSLPYLATSTVHILKQMSANRPWLAEFQRDAHARARQNREEALNYLYRWRYSTFDVLKLNAGIKAERGGQFIRRMLDDKLITEVFCPTLRSNALTLTSAGLTLASMAVLAESQRHTSYTRIPATLARHSLYTQRVAIARKHVADEIHPEKPLPENEEVKGYKKVPDFQYKSGDQWHAVEVELIRKSVPKIMVALDTYASAISHGMVSSVEYVFSHEAVHSLYLDLFNREEWQLFSWDDKEKRYRPTEKVPVLASNKIRTKFKFKVEGHPYD